MSEYGFTSPDRTPKYPTNPTPKSPKQLKEEFIMVDRAVMKIEELIKEVNWALLIGNQRLTETFVEAKTGLMASKKKLAKVRDAIMQEIGK